MVNRHPDWSRKLSDFLKNRRALPFQWGSNDCLAFASAAVQALTGVDFFSEYAGYSDESEAAELLKQNGGVKGIIRKHLGGGTNAILSAKRGDIALVRMPRDTAGVVDDSGQFIALISPSGMVRVPLSKATRVWSY